MSRLRAIKDSIAHWERMIEWADGQHNVASVDVNYMHEVLGESDGMEDCALCQRYAQCRCCPLFKAGHGCSRGAYSYVSDAETWGAWRVAARNMLDVLKGLEACYK